MGALMFSIERLSDAARPVTYGRCNYCVGLTDGREVSITADRVVVDATGALLTYVNTRHDSRTGGTDKDFPEDMMFALASGEWTHIYTAGIFSDPVTVEHLVAPKSKP
jgi:hypothetical protein